MANVRTVSYTHLDVYKRQVRINGRLSDDPEDSVKVDLTDINMGSVFDIASISDDVNFEGDATGTAYALSLIHISISIIF